ncbi:MAG: nicotinamide-nucleotide amidohydrolase family protein [Chloroflexi bacterium]|nr:nicotinamide-nucleotide amidohydrolase family protein [Chloroflexota bacterium]
MPPDPQGYALAEQVGVALRRAGYTLAVAESCSGGLLLSLLTDVPGSSDYLAGGIVSYSNEAKQGLLGVRGATLAAHGAVSAETAREMARGVRQRLGADLGLAVTGIAGPGGGSAEKPVGLVHIALAAAGGERLAQHVWPGSRWANKRQSAHAALRLLLAHLASPQEEMPHRGAERTEGE